MVCARLAPLSAVAFTPSFVGNPAAKLGIHLMLRCDKLRPSLQK
jgi:hypothetical protein